VQRGFQNCKARTITYYALFLSSCGLCHLLRLACLQ
jgi:hypothetical protein